MAGYARSPNHLRNSIATNLPVHLTSFIGREREVAELKRRLSLSDSGQDVQSDKGAGREGARLLTLTGPGGCGKTRLAIRVASQLLANYPDGVWCVELAHFNNPALVPHMLAHALGLRETSPASLLDTLTQYLKTRHLLLVLDNCEHLLQACAEIALALLPSCPGLQILATSREPLGIPGEVTWLVPSLSLPESTQSPSDWTQSDAVHLFVDRAASVLSTFALTAGNATAVAQICQRLDGMPLAIELAAARARVLTVEQIAARLDDRFALLTSRNRTALIPRHQTLQAAIDWSHDLLSDQERALFYRLSVFAGGFTLEAAEAVGAGGDVEKQNVLDLLSQLADKSMVVAETKGSSEARYHLLETIRQYAQEKLLGSGEEETVRSRHFRFYLAMAEEADPKLRGLELVTWLDRLESEHDNFRAALAWGLLRNAEAALRIAAALAWFWRLHDHFREGRHWVAQALAASPAGPAPIRAKALAGAALMAYLQMDLEPAQALAEEGLRLAREHNDPWGIGWALHGLGRVYHAQRDYERAQATLEESLRGFTDSGDRWSSAYSFWFLGLVARDQRNYERAISLLEEAVARFRGLGDTWGLTWALYHLARALYLSGDYVRAAALNREGLPLAQKLGTRYGIGAFLKALARIALIQQQWEPAARLHASGDALYNAIGGAGIPAGQDETKRDLAALRSAMGEERFAAVSAEGRAMAMDEAVVYALKWAHPEMTSHGRPNVKASSLPVQLTSFVGREREVADLKLRLSPSGKEQDIQSQKGLGREGARLLTLTGPGGCGKTRLAIRVASQLLTDFTDGVWWVELAALSDPRLVPMTVAQALALREISDATVLETLTRYLQTKSLLLVLDNCEHLLKACAALVLALLPSCPDLQILTTTREPLGIPGEVAWLVPSLSLPDSAHLPSDWTQYDAIRLFIERAASVLSTFALTPSNAMAVAQVCRRLDGMPLAIELAAARVRVLAVEQIAARLDDRFALLTSGNRTALIPRHQTLRAAIAWSDDLLSDQERALFYRLSVFAGGFTLEAAEAVGAGGNAEKQDALDLLSQLVDKSMVVAETKGSSEARYHLLETIRQYAQEKLVASGEAEQVRARHLAFYVALAEAGEPHLRGPDQLRWLKRLEADHDNLRAALAWSLAGEGRAEAALRIVGALKDFWGLHSYYGEGIEWTQKALDKGQDAPAAVRAKALMGVAWLVLWSGELERPRAMYQEACTLYEALGDRLNRAHALAGLGHVVFRQGNFTLGASLFQEALPVFQAAGDQQAVADSLKGMGHIAISQGDHATAGRYYDEVLAIQRGLGDRQWLCSALNSVATVAVERGDYRRAAKLWAESLTIRLEYGERLGMRYELSGLADVAAAVGQPSLAVRLHGVAEARNRAIGVRWHSIDQAETDQELASLRAKLGEAAFEEAWAEGLAMPLEQAVEQALSLAAHVTSETEHARQTMPDVQSPTLVEPLNEREVEVLRLIADGLSNHEIADRLVLAVSTVKWHINNLFAKLAVRSRTQAVARARELGLL